MGGPMAMTCTLQNFAWSDRKMGSPHMLTTPARASRPDMAGQPQPLLMCTMSKVGTPIIGIRNGHVPAAVTYLRINPAVLHHMITGGPSTSTASKRQAYPMLQGWSAAYSIKGINT
jgi:hypothetical protein